MTDISFHLTGDGLWQRMERADRKVQERLIRVGGYLEAAGIRHAMVGECAVRAWVTRADEAAARGTRDVEVLLRRGDFFHAQSAFEAAGFSYRAANGVEIFLDSPDAKSRESFRAIYANELEHPEDVEPAPDADDYEKIDGLRILKLAALVRMKLSSYRIIDRVNLNDLIDVELVDATWCARLPPELAARLQHLIDTPGG